MRRRALLAGVDEYERNSGVAPLRYGTEDAVAIGRLLRHTCGFETVNVLAGAREGSDGHATANAIFDHIDYAIQDLEQDDLFLLAFFMHGVSREVDGVRREFLLPQDARLDRPWTYVEHAMILKELERLHARRRVLVLDCCRNDPDASRGEGGHVLGTDLARDLALAVPASPDGVGSSTCVLAACAKGERAYESDHLGHGMFAYHLLRGIEGQAWRDGVLDVQDLAAHVEGAVGRTSKGRQRPQFRREGVERILIAARIEPRAEAPPEVQPAQRVEREAALGDAVEQVKLAWKYENGLGVARNDAEAVRLYRLAADQGNAHAQCNLGWMYHLGRGVRQDDGEAVRLSRLAADQGNAGAQNNLGWMYQVGRGVGQDDGEAVRLYRLAAEQGYAAAQGNLGWMCQHGRGVRQDDGEAVRFLRLAADQGDAAAQSNLGWMYQLGRGVGQDDGEAVRLTRLAADQGNAGAQNNLGWMYDTGRGVAQDHGEAVRLFGAAAVQGHAGAQVNLGSMYSNARGVRQDDAEALRLYRLSAGQGDAGGQRNLGWACENGRGIARNLAEAVRFYRLAAAQGDAFARDRLREHRVPLPR